MSWPRQSLQEPAVSPKKPARMTDAIAGASAAVSAFWKTLLSLVPATFSAVIATTAMSA